MPGSKHVGGFGALMLVGVLLIQLISSICNSSPCCIFVCILLIKSLNMRSVCGRWVVVNFQVLNILHLQITLGIDLISMIQ